MSVHDIRTASVEEFLARLGSAEPTPGGGSGAALTGALGASLVRMLALLSVGRSKHAEHDRLMEAIAEQAAEECATLLALAEQDAAAYGAVLAAYALPKTSDDARTARGAAVQAALRGACEVPLRVMERCLEVIAMAKTAVQHGNRNAVCDGAAGCEFARAAMRAAALSVKANLALLEDATYAQQARGRMDEIDYMGGAAASEIDSRVQDLLRPAPSVRGS